jgi:hypothetical protein
MAKDVPSVGRGDPSSDDEKRPAKKSKATDANKKGVASGKRVSVQVLPRLPRPVRINRVVNPGAPDKPSAKRTPVQVAAEKQRQAKLKEALDALQKRQAYLVAQMEINIKTADEEEARRVVKTLPVDSDAEMADPIENFSDMEVGGDTDIDEEMEDAVPAKNAVCLIFSIF